MNKLLIASILLLTLQGCFNTNEELKSIKEDIEQIKESEQVKLEEEVLKDKKELEAKVDKLEKEKELEQEEEIKEKDNLLKEIEDLKKEVKEKPKAKVNKFGPGNANNLQGYSDGYVRIHTRSANGKLTLRSGPEQNASKIVEISNGTDDIYYFNRVKIGEYVWYQVNYTNYSGYLRGDYLHRY